MPPRERRPTLRDIAEETGLSSAAVSYALRGLQVPLETQQRVKEVAERLGYQVDPIARALASGRTGYVGVLCGSLQDSWQQSLAADLGRGLMEAKRNALIVDASNDPQLEASLAQQLVDQRVDALICLPVDPGGAHWARIARKAVLVSIGDGLPGAATAAEVVFDNAGAVTDALTRLAGVGHNRVAVLTPVGVSTPDRPAESVVPRVSRELGIRATLHSSPHDLDGACAVASKVLVGAEPPTAFLCLADSIAYGVYAAGLELGLRVPQDISVIGFDDYPVSRLLTAPLSSYRWPVEELVAAVVQRTVQAVDHGKRSKRKVLHATPQMRGSVKPPRT
ncbi:MAG: LacI family DNA-binding transcriptional regulator [Propionibacteriales bacterium]|nr:LacI family DNA-binding transcriptional regulator [Propionibacteriales bacterium]